MSLGADDYLTKPFDGSELLSVVETRLRKHELVATSFSRDIKDVDSFFNHIKESNGLDQLSSARSHRRIRKKDFLFIEGQDPMDLFFLQKGKVKTFKTTRDGKELVTGIHTDGAFIGFLCLLENAPYLESAVALEDSEVYLVPASDFNTLIYSNREIASRFIKLLANNLVEIEQRLLEMAYQSVRQRVASSLLKVLDRLDTHKVPDLVTVSRRDLSGIVGTATESLNRTLADFRDEGIVKLKDSGIQVLDRSRLESLAK
jgi:CRP-like cAMP-binding protein